MYHIKPLPEFDAWFDSLTDPATRARLIRRLEKAARGLLGDVKLVGEGVSSLALAGACITPSRATC